jgi:hypothetical protein
VSIEFWIAAKRAKRVLIVIDYGDFHGYLLDQSAAKKRHQPCMLRPTQITDNLVAIQPERRLFGGNEV